MEKLIVSIILLSWGVLFIAVGVLMPEPACTCENFFLDWVFITIGSIWLIVVLNFMIKDFIIDVHYMLYAKLKSNYYDWTKYER